MIVYRAQGETQINNLYICLFAYLKGKGKGAEW